MLPTLQPLIPLDNTLGAILIGGIVAGILYGIACIQSYTYFTKNHKDGKLLKTVILLLWTLNTLHLALIAHCLYFYMVLNSGNYFALELPVWSMLIQLYVANTSDLIIRWLFGRRVWLLSRKNYLLAICIALVSLLALASGFVFATWAFIQGLTLVEFSRISYLIYTGLGRGIAADTLIATFLCINLWRRRTGFKKTDSLVRTLMMYTINTALLTTLSCMACLISYAILPDGLVFIAIFFPLSSLFFNSLLASLNSRGVLSEKMNAITHVSIPGSILNTGPTNGISGSGFPPVKIGWEEIGDRVGMRPLQTSHV